MKLYSLKYIYRETDDIEKTFIFAYIFSLSCIFIYSPTLNNILLLLAVLFFSYFGISYRITKNENKINEKHSIIKILKNDPGFLKHNIDIQEKIFKFLSNNNINEQNADGDTLLLYIAKYNKYSPYIGMLLLMGADPHIKNNKNESAIQYIGKEYQEVMVEHEQKILTKTFNQRPDIKLQKMKNRL